MPIKSNEIAAINELIKQQSLPSKKGWRSFNHENESAHSIVIDVENIAQLQALMRKVYELNANKPSNERITLRAAAGGIKGDAHSDSYSFSSVATADIIVRLVGDDFRKIEPVLGKENQIKVGASLQIGEVNEALYENFNLSLPTASLIPYVTVAGLSATAGHGTGKNQPSFAGLIQAMTLCLPNGEIVRIDSNHPDFETIRASHLGLFGIVLDAELTCTEAKKMRCIMDVNSVPEFLRKVKAGLFTKYPYVSAMYMPTYRDNELTNEDSTNIIVYAWEPVPKATNDMNSNPDLTKFGQKVAIAFEDGLHLVDLLRTFPSLVPYYMRYFASKIAIGNKDNVAIGPWHEIVHYQTAFPWDLTEFGPLFQVSDTPADGVVTPEIALAFETLVKELMKSAQKGEYPLVYAAYLRYFQGTNGGLSMNMHREGHHVCAMDMTTGHDMPGLKDFFARMASFTMGQLGAKPHWGKNIPAQTDFKQLYGEAFVKFTEALENWYRTQGMDLSKSALLNGTLSHVLNQHPVPSPTISPPRKHVCTWEQAKKMATTLIEHMKDDDNDDAKKLIKELTKHCLSHTETLVSRTLGTVFYCFKEGPAGELPPRVSLR